MAGKLVPIKGQDGYFVSERGLIWSRRSNRVVRGSTAGRGYRYIQFPDGSREYIHRLVCKAFHGESKGREVRHLDGSITNNSANNLAWGTKQENDADKFRHGTNPKGERNPQSKLTWNKVSEMRQFWQDGNETYGQIAARFGVSTMTAWRAIKRESWT